jgi:hypothetical protein
MPEVLDFRWPEIQRGGPDQGSNPGWPCSEPLSTSAVAFEKVNANARSWASCARRARPSQLLCDIASCAATRRCSCRNSRLTSHVPGSVLRSRRYLLFCWLLCRTSNSLKQITKAGVLRLPCFRCATSACGSFFLGPVPATKFTAEAVYCQSHAAPSCRTWESIASK